MTLNKFHEDIAEYLKVKCGLADAELMEAAEFIACRAWRLCCEAHSNYIAELNILENKNRMELLRKLIERDKAKQEK